MADAISSSGSSNPPTSDASSCVLNEVNSTNSADTSQTFISHHHHHHHHHLNQEDEEANHRMNFQWSLEDEIEILGGMIEYREKVADSIVKLNAKDVSEFNDYIVYRLSGEVSASKLGRKIRQLKNKYEAMSWKERRGGENEIKGDHDREVYWLARGLWGDVGGRGFRKRPGLRSAHGR